MERLRRDDVDAGERDVLPKRPPYGIGELRLGFRSDGRRDGDARLTLAAALEWKIDPHGDFWRTSVVGLVDPDPTGSRDDRR